MAYIGREPQIGNYQVCDAISVVNAQAAYTMQVNSVNVIPESVNHMIVSLNGVIQNPGSSYTISGATITFSSNLATGDSIDFIYLLGNVLDLGTPSDDTVTGAKIVDNAINSEHYTDGSIDLAHLSADSVDGSKIADDAINSEHYTDGSIDTAHIADGQVTTAKLATAVFTGATDIGAAIVDADLFLMDDGAGGTIRKTTASRLKTYAGVSGDVTTIDSLFKADIKIGEDDQTKIDFAIPNTIQIFQNNNERARVSSDGDVFFHKTSGDIDTAGCDFRTSGFVNFTRDSDVVFLLNRMTNDGDIVDFEGNGNKEGTISVSGTTIAYNTFTGTHWSRLSDNSKPTILRGTVMESLDEMVNWYQLRFTHNGKAERITHVLLDSQSVGDEITYNHNGTDVTATIIKEGDIKHVQTKISTTDASKNVYGVFFDWDNSEGDAGYNDMMIAAVGTYVVRIHKDETVVKGNLLQSNGDGTAKVLAGNTSITADVLSTVFAKVLSNTKIETYADGSYIVPCAFTNC